MASSATVSSISNRNESDTEERRRDSSDGKETGPNFTSSSANEQSCCDEPPQNNNDEASEQQLSQIPEGWSILERENPEYGRNMLSSHYRCLDCRNTHKTTKKLKPHCLCSLNNDQDENSVDACGIKKSCNWKCPVRNGRELSHCPTCLCRYSLYHRPKYSSLIDLYFCNNCESFYNKWSKRDDKNNWSGWEHFNCSNSKAKGDCFKRWTCKFLYWQLLQKNRYNKNR